MSWKIARATFARAVLAGGALVAVSACKDKSPTGPGTGNLQVITTSSGQDIDADGYTVAVDNGSAQVIGASDTIAINDLPEGGHTVVLAGLASNCSADASSKDVTIGAGATASVTFTVTCTAAAGTGGIHVTTTSSGAHVDPNGYTITVDGGQPKSIGASDTTTIGGVTAGSHTVALSGLASNCTVTQGSTTVNVTADTPAAVTFNITCGVRTLAFESDALGNSDIYSIKEDGSGLAQLTNDTSFEGFATFSPDGAKIAFTRFTNGNLDVWVMDANGGNAKQLTSDPAEDGVTSWSPDGTKIAFASTRGGDAQIWVMNADGSNPTQLTHMTDPGTTNDTTALATKPAWSPDGTTIAFQSRQSGNYHIWVIGADGQNLKELSQGTDDESPDWSPDGKTIAFQSKQSSGHYELFTMNANGTNPTALTSGSGFENEGPRYSTDGKTIAFYSDRPGGSGATFQVYTMDLATKAVTHVNTDTAEEGRPSWRP